MENYRKNILNLNGSFMFKMVSLIIFVLLFQACEDGFLEQTNPNALTSGSFWKNNSDLNAGLVSAYSALKNNNILGIQEEAVRTDFAVPSSFRQRQVGNEMFNQEFTGNTRYVSNKWNALYLGIFRTNQVIINYDRISANYTTDEAKEDGLRILAQARALRGYFYFVLNNSFNNGSVPLLDFIPETFDEFQQAFSISQKIKDFYREDLKYGVENLPENYTDWQDIANTNLGRITAGACEALLGKSYLYENNFPIAESHFKNVIDNYGYVLVDDMAKCFTGIDEFNSESIFELNFTTAINLEADGEEVLSHNITHSIYNAFIQPSSRLTLKYRADKVDKNDPINIVQRDSLDTQGNAVEDNDGNVLKTMPAPRIYSIRMGNCMGQVDDPNSPMYGTICGEYGNLAGVAPFARNRQTMFKKYLHWNTIGGGAGEDRSSTLNNKSDINIMILRLADIYLSYAECMLEKGDLSEALKYINRVRKRSHLILLGKSSDSGAEFNNAETTYVDDIDLDSTNGDQEVAVTNLMDHLRFTEIPLELCLEGDRATDLRRWGVFKSLLQEMASAKYDYWHYEKNLNGKHNRRFKCYTTLSGVAPTSYTGVKVFPQPIEVQDAVVGSGNFDPNFHNYLPIPQAEIDANLNWDVVK